MYANTITPRRILDYVSEIKKDLATLKEGNYTGADAAKWLAWHVEQIEFQARYMIDDAYTEAVEDRDKSVLKTLAMCDPEYRLRAEIALTKIIFEDAAGVCG